LHGLWYNGVTQRDEANGYSVDSKEHILEILKQDGPMTVGDLAKRLSLSRSATRHHLRVLERNGLIAALGTMTPRGVGRPGLLYGLTAHALDAFPHGYDRLAERLLREMKETLSAAQVVQCCERMGREMAAEAPRRIPGQPIDAFLQDLVVYLTQHGYLARIVQDGGQRYLELGNCPYARVVEKHPEVCTLDQAMLRELLTEKIRPVHLWTGGGQTCRFAIPPSTTPSP